MRLAVLQSAFRAGCWAALGAGVLAAGRAQAQEAPVIFLSRSAGSTPASTVINAQANYVAAQGYFLHSAAIARKINAEAVAIEIENWPKFVNAYFEGRELNRKWREIERGGTHLEKLTKIQQARIDLMKSHFEDLLKRDPVESLNWLLTELSGPTMAVQYTMGRDSLRPFDQKLDPEALDLIYVTDGGRGNSKLVFPLGKPTAGTPWPYALRASEFDAARGEFESARKVVMEDLQKDGHAGDESGKRLMKSVSQLLSTLDTVYPKETRRDAAVFLDYNSAKYYLQSLVTQVHRALNTTDTSVFKGSLAFKGETVLDLVQYMYQKGLVFNKGKSEGSERIYRNLLMNMRNIYLTLGSEKNADGKN